MPRRIRETIRERSRPGQKLMFSSEMQGRDSEVESCDEMENVSEERQETSAQDRTDDVASMQQKHTLDSYYLYCI